jgi:fatty-acid peroxygenase
MPKIPRDPAFDSIFALLGDPYRFIGKRCRRFQSDLFQTRLLTTKAICMTGVQAAELFSDNARFQRHNAAPKRLAKTLAGVGGVQGLDGERHRHRKALFLEIVADDRVARLAEGSRYWWRNYALRWQSEDRIVLYEEAREIVCRSVCQWAGVPLPAEDVARRTRELAAMYEYCGSAGPMHYWARIARRRCERWIGELVAQTRRGEMTPPADSALHKVAWHRELNGNYLEPRIAAVELLNVLRPAIAVSVWMTHAAVALHEHPECRERLRSDGEPYAEMFAQEVRRYFPFVPFIGAKVARGFEWNGYHFAKGTRVLLDLYGTNHDERYWDTPQAFRPERFATWKPDPFSFIPQGPGDRALNHRCPGEGIALALLKVAAAFLTEELTYEVPPQDLALEFSSMPALPKSRMQIAKVRLAACEASHAGAA